MMRLVVGFERCGLGASLEAFVKALDVALSEIKEHAQPYMAHVCAKEIYCARAKIVICLKMCIHFVRACMLKFFMRVYSIYLC